MFRLDEQTQMVAGVIRQWCQSALQPKIPALEAGTEMPFELMKKMAKQFGFDAMLGSSVKKRIAKLRSGEDAASEGIEKLSGGSPMMMHVVIKELSRVSPGFAMGFGVSMGLVGGAIVAKGNADQIERWLTRFESSSALFFRSE